MGNQLLYAFHKKYLITDNAQSSERINPSGYYRMGLAMIDWDAIGNVLAIGS